jgi:hypothetical protein
MNKKIKIYMDNCCYNRPFDYTEWRKNNLFVGMSLEEISKDAMKIHNNTFNKIIS